MTSKPSGYRQLADHLECHVETVRLAFSMECIPAQMSKAWLEEQGQLARRYELAITATSKLVRRLTELGEPSCEQLIYQYGCPSVLELAAMQSAMEEQMSIVAEWAGTEQRRGRGGRDPAAGTVARGVARLFCLMGLPLTYGHDDGVPNTEFGRAVLLAFSAFAVEANWRQYAAEARSNVDIHKSEAQKLAKSQAETEKKVSD